MCQGHAARADARAENEIEFISVDGEGETVDGEHRYVLLSVGDRSLDRGGEPLTHRDIFPFLWECFEENPKAAFVGFFLAYDFTMWVRSLPESRGLRLFDPQCIAARARTKSGPNRTPFPVEIDEEWEVDFLGVRRMKLRKIGSKSWMYICDSGSFFQTSFLNAIDPKRWGADLADPDERAIIEEGKGKRGDAQFGAEMIRYNVTENRVMSKLMTTFNKGLMGVDIKLNRRQWFGPGQTAQAWLNNIEAPTSEQVAEVTPDFILESAANTYFGGWFEIFAHGLVGDAYEYDINSAYPSIMAKLPCLLHGEWEVSSLDRPPTTLDAFEAAPWTIVMADIESYEYMPAGPAPYRTSDGNVLRPRRQQGWYWASELMEAEVSLIERCRIRGSMTYHPCDCPPPLREIADLYRQRLEVGKNSAAGVALKLVYNSCYGKFSQSVGAPKYGNPIYASLITSGCRTQILRAINTHPQGWEDLLMVATDGVYFRTPHPKLTITDELGEWDSSTKKNLSLFKPGVYWDDAARETVEWSGKIPLKSRGVSARGLAGEINHIDDMWRNFDIDNPQWPEVHIPLGFSMTTPAMALHRGKWDTCGTVAFDSSAVQSADPRNKRTGVHRGLDGLVRTEPYAEMPELLSTPYDRKFGMELERFKELSPINPITPWGNDVSEMLTGGKPPEEE